MQNNRILIADDEPDFTEIIGQLLKVSASRLLSCTRAARLLEGSRG